MQNRVIGMSRILLSIKPEYVEKILNGDKKFEYRKTMAKRKVNKIVIYATSPVMKIVGEVEVRELWVNDPDTIWQKTKKHSGISEEFFYRYYENKRKAVVYELGEVIEYKYPIELHEIGINFAPQSYLYLD